MNASTFSTKTETSHTAYEGTRTRAGPRKAGDECVRDDGDEDDGQYDCAEGEARDRTPVPAQVALRCVERRVEQHGRDEQHEDELRIEHE